MKIKKTLNQQFTNYLCFCYANSHIINHIWIMNHKAYAVKCYSNLKNSHPTVLEKDRVRRYMCYGVSCTAWIWMFAAILIGMAPDWLEKQMWVGRGHAGGWRRGSCVFLCPSSSRDARLGCHAWCIPWVRPPVTCSARHPLPAPARRGICRSGRGLLPRWCGCCVCKGSIARWTKRGRRWIRQFQNLNL